MFRHGTAVILLLALAAPAVAADAERPGYLGFGFTYHHERDAAGKTVGWMTIHRLADGGPAQKAGLQVHDVITAIDRKPLAFTSDVQALELLGRLRAGQRVVLSVRRGAATTSIAIVPAPMTGEQFAKWKKNLEAARQAER